jgi:hypothetical protein
MDRLLETVGAWLAVVNAFYGFLFVLLPAITFAFVPLLVATAWTVASHARGRRPFPRIPTSARRLARLSAEVAFGLLNPILYLVVIVPTMRRGQVNEWGLALAWILLAAFWSARMGGAAFGGHPARARIALRVLLLASLGCVAAYALQDAFHAARTFQFSRIPMEDAAMILVRVGPLYLVPAVLLIDYLLASRERHEEERRTWRGLFLLPGGGARLALAVIVFVAAGSGLAALHRRSEGSVRGLVATHSGAIDEVARRYDLDPRLLASIVYVAHRDEVSPFRATLERVAVGAWAASLRSQLGLRAPDLSAEMGPDENPLLNEALDVSVGLAQIKPRTAQTASVLATGAAAVDLPGPLRHGYLNAEPAGGQWRTSVFARTPLPSPLPVPATRTSVADVLLDDGRNIEMAALILALYQQQWEAMNPAWGIRERPEILATLYQIGFARSKPHAQPQPSAFGRRVREVSEQPWLTELFAAGIR